MASVVLISGSAAPVPRKSKPRRSNAADFVKLAESCERLVYQAALRVTGDPADAEDVRQQTLLKAYTRLGEFDPRVAGERARFHSWVCRVAINESIDMLRKKRAPRNGHKISLDEMRRDEDGVERRREIAAPTENPEQLCARRELRQILAKAIEELEPTSRAVCLLRDVENYSTEETARYLGISGAAVRIRLFRARAKLRDRLRHLFEVPGGPQHIPASPCSMPSMAYGD